MPGTKAAAARGGLGAEGEGGRQLGAVCRANKREGSPCTAPATGPNGCFEREVETEFVTLEHDDGTVSRWPLGDEGFKEVSVHEYERGGRHFYGEEPGRAHPFVVALRTATNLEALMAEQGTVLDLWLEEDAIIRGLRERPGPPVEWNEDGTVCS